MCPLTLLQKTVTLHDSWKLGLNFEIKAYFIENFTFVQLVSLLHVYDFFDSNRKNLELKNVSSYCMLSLADKTSIQFDTSFYKNICVLDCGIRLVQLIRLMRKR